jgi:hypothetical protein
MIKMAEALAQTECSFESLTNNEKSIKLSDFRKCVDLKQQLHQALNELSSGQLINDSLNKEQNQGSMNTAISQQVRTDLEKYDKWKLVTPRYPKVKIGDKNKKKLGSI